MKQPVLLFCMQVVSYTILTSNFRFIAQGNLAGALATDAMHASISFFVIRKIATSTDQFGPWVGYVLGCLVGTAIGMHVS